MSTYRLSFPRNLDGEGVVRTLGGFSGLLLPWWKRWVAQPFVALEVHADAAGIRHYLSVPSQWKQAVRNTLQAAAPSIRFEATELPEITVRSAGEYRLSSQTRPLLMDVPGISAKLLSSLHPLDRDEMIVVQWLITPHAPVEAAKPAVGKPDRHWLPTVGGHMDAEAVGAMRKKHEAPLLLASGRIGTLAATRWRELRLLRQVETAWHETRAPGVHLRRRLLSNKWVAKSMDERRTPFSSWPATLNAEELAGFIGWPTGVVALPGLVLGGSRQVPPSPLIPSTGTVIADSTYPGNHRPMALDIDGPAKAHAPARSHRHRQEHADGADGARRSRGWTGGGPARPEGRPGSSGA